MGFLVAVLGVVEAMAQLPEQMAYREAVSPEYYFEAYTQAAGEKGKTLLKTAVKVANDELQFSQMEQGYRATFEYTVIIFDTHGDQLYSDIRNKTVTVAGFSETNSDADFSLLESEFILVPGDYETAVTVTDLDTKISNKRRMKINIRDYTVNKLDLSSIVFADRIGLDESGNRKAVPNVVNNFSHGQDTLHICFEIYNTLYFDSLNVAYRIFNSKNKLVNTSSFYQKITEGRTPVLFSITRSDLPNGKYLFEIEVGENDISVKRTIPFSINWLHLMPMASDIESAIDELKYIATTKEIRKMKKAPEEDRGNLFEEFWRQRDPSPGTPKNELFDEYYRRISYANATFGKYTEGWKTDMGMVFIRLGPPDEVERYPFAPESKPYQIWYYHRAPYVLIFVDHSGFGEFRLTIESVESLNRMIQ